MPQGKTEVPEPEEQGPQDPSQYNRNRAMAQAAERREKAWELLKAGYPERRAATVLGVSRALIRKYRDQILEDLHESQLKKAEQWRKIELERLEDLHRQLMFELVVKLKDGEGKEILDAKTGQPLTRLNLQVAEKLIRLSERRAKLLGLDAPSKVAFTNPNGDKPYDGFENALDNLSDQELEKLEKLGSKIWQRPAPTRN